MQKIFFLILIGSLALSCGKKEDKKTTYRETPISESQIELIMENQISECAMIDGTQCPQGITRIFTINKKRPSKSTVCSGFMIGPTTLVTNHHCIPDQNACNSTYLAIFDNRNYQRSTCKKVLATKQDFLTRDPRKKIDVSIIEIATEYSGEFFELKSTRLSEGDKVSAVVIDHTGLDAIRTNLLESRITELQCEFIKWDLSSSLTLKNCPVIGGNSGSPVLNNDGKVIGIIWGSHGNIDQHVRSSMSLLLRRNESDLKALVTPSYYIKKMLRN